MCMSSKGHLKMSEKKEPIYPFSHNFQTVIIKDPKILQNIFSAVTQYIVQNTGPYAFTIISWFHNGVCNYVIFGW